MRHFGIVTVGRSDFSIYESLLKTYKKNKLKFTIIASTAHFQKKFGYTIEEVRKYKEVDIHEVDMGIEVKNSVDVSTSISEHIKGFSSVISELSLDGVVILGDRYEALAAAIASGVQLVPIFHLHGGVVTEGSLDDAFRFSISKLASYHFVDNIHAKKRLCQMGEPPDRIFHVGAMSLENINSSKDIEDIQFFNQVFSTNEKKNFALATYHPSTKTTRKDSTVLRNLFSSLSKYSGNILFTYPNADAKNEEIISLIKKRSEEDTRIFLVKNLGSSLYYSALRRAEFMIGNSSSGIIESMAFKLPVINIGSRQQGRDCNENVINVSEHSASITKGIRKSLNPTFINSFKKTKDIYFKKGVTESIIRKLEKLKIDDSILQKRFYELT